MSASNFKSKTACCGICSNRAKEGYCKEIRSDRFGRHAEDEHYCYMFKPNAVADMFSDIFRGFNNGK